MSRLPVTVFLCAALAATSMAAQEQVSTMSRSGLLKSQTSVLDGRAAEQYENSVRLLPPRAEGITRTPAYTGNYNGPHLPLAQAAATRHGIPVGVFLRLVAQESGWNPTARSVKGALGLAQLMPETARALAVDPLDPEQNLDGGARYLRAQYETFGSWPLALAAYNAGPGAVERYRGIPPFAETQNYVRVIWGD
ncbi:Transglycosylase SLT domain-containing protein [Yoonia rosea]|uniref:Transglycosylase SLT domain-containing protein n=1 Tax=Yoonia rosea TaxID=287098 RepID=A0A1R3WNT2_9RHOB|nr:lytic transglycosylase domain-containing protein [Yoonia rosea]SIT79116.1 Transglycosylase SLT domain-containing protein [Yoonia rosea]